MVWELVGMDVSGFLINCHQLFRVFLTACMHSRGSCVAHERFDLILCGEVTVLFGFFVCLFSKRTVPIKNLGQARIMADEFLTGHSSAE